MDKIKNIWKSYKPYETSLLFHKFFNKSLATISANAPPESEAPEAPINKHQNYFFVFLTQIKKIAEKKHPFLDNLRVRDPPLLFFIGSLFL